MKSFYRQLAFLHFGEAVILAVALAVPTRTFIGGMIVGTLIVAVNNLRKASKADD